MTYSFKTLTISAVLFVSSLIIVGTMHLPIFNGADGFEVMESSFNSLRKGVKPPFDSMEKENNVNLGKNINITLVFRDNSEARIVTMMFLRNKLTVTPKGRTINIQGDLGYTLKFFMNDIHLLYMNKFKELENRYSIPPSLSMYLLNRILQKMAVAMDKQKMGAQKILINNIREKLLIPAYNLREALPVSETSGFLSITLGTLGILTFAILWDISNFLFFGTLASEDFMKSVRIMLGRELSDAEKKRIAIRKKKMAKAMQDRRKKVEKSKKIKSTRTNKDALKKIPEPKVKSENSAEAKKKTVKKKKTAPERATPKPGTKSSVGSDAQQKKKIAKKNIATQKDAAGKPVKKVSEKKVKESTSQTKSKKVTTQQGRKKAAAKAKPESGNKPESKPAAKAVKKKPVKPQKAAQEGIKPDEQ